MEGRVLLGGGSNSLSTSKFVLGMAALVLGLLRNTCEGSAPGRSLLLDEDSITHGSFRMTMMHRDHVNSPLRHASTMNYSFAERLKIAFERSKARSKHLRGVMASVTGSSGSSSFHPREAQLLGVKSKVNAQEGEYVVQIQLGTPPHNFISILDSGGDLNWVQCTPSNPRIPSPHPLFDPTRSSTYKKLACNNTFCTSLPLPRLSCNSSSACRYQYGYGDGTTSTGDLASETLQLTSTSAAAGYKQIHNFAFGCGRQNSGDLAGSDGIVGIGQGPLSMPSQLGLIVGRKFAFCLVGMFEETTVTSPLIIGEDALRSSANSLWTPIVKNSRSPSWYYLEVECIKISNRCLSIPSSAFRIASNGGGGTILDTGTTMTELVPAAFDALVSGLKSAISYPEADGSWYGFDLCFDTSASSNSAVFPTISFTFSRSSVLSLPTDNAFLQVDTSVYCLMITSGYSFNIIGNIQLQNFYFFVNLETNVIGWKPYQCDTIQ